MLEKDPSSPEIHRLRSNPETRRLRYIQWRTLMHSAEDQKLLNEGQYGSRPHRNAHDPVFIEEMQFEICRASQKPLVKFDFDATSCYDRILPNMASIP
jgi:hypothetical protein